jgi:ubiquinone biosynthesis protein
LIFLAKLIERYIKEAKVYDPKSLVEEFKSYIMSELDLNNEMISAEMFRRNFRLDKRVYFPYVYKKFCSHGVLVTEKITGIKLSELAMCKKDCFDKKYIGRLLMDTVLKQMFVDGFFHGDPHPGNIFVMDESRIAFVDFGIVGRIEEDERFELLNILLSAVDRDAERMIEIFRNMEVLGTTNERAFKLSLELLLDKYYGASAVEFRMNDFLKDLTKVLYENKVRILPSHFLFLKTLAVLESVAQLLDPQLNMALEIKKISGKIIKEEYSMARVSRKIQVFGRDLFGFVRNLPKDLITIVNELKKGNLKIGFEHLNLENLISMMDRVSNRLSFSLIIAALIIGSSILIQANAQTFFGSARHLGVLGFLMAIIMGLWLLIHILRSGKL